MTYSDIKIRPEWDGSNPKHIYVEGIVYLHPLDKIIDLDFAVQFADYLEQLCRYEIKEADYDPTRYAPHETRTIPIAMVTESRRFQFNCKWTRDPGPAVTGNEKPKEALQRLDADWNF